MYQARGAIFGLLYDIFHATDQIFLLILCVIFHFIFVTSSCIMLFHSKCLRGTQG
jgi:hypothetical protein